MGMIVPNRLITDPFCGLRRDEAFKNFRGSLVVRLSNNCFQVSKTDTLPFVKWTKRQGVRLFSGAGRKAKMQTNEMFAFWKGGATERVRDGF